MASAFWTLEDGRTFARRWSAMAFILQLITAELKSIDGAEEFCAYLEKFVFKEEEGDIANGFGGFIRDREIVMFNFDLRSFTPTNQGYFWQATQNALAKQKSIQNSNNEIVVFLLITLLDMHKRIQLRENPMQLNHLKTITPAPKEKLGPGW